MPNNLPTGFLAPPVGVCLSNPILYNKLLRIGFLSFLSSNGGIDSNTLQRDSYSKSLISLSDNKHLFNTIL